MIVTNKLLLYDPSLFGVRKKAYIVNCTLPGAKPHLFQCFPFKCYSTLIFIVYNISVNKLFSTFLDIESCKKFYYISIILPILCSIVHLNLFYRVIIRKIKIK